MEMIHPIKPLYSHKELKQKMRSLAGRVSTDLEVVSEAELRRQRASAETARRAAEEARREAERERLSAAAREAHQRRRELVIALHGAQRQAVSIAGFGPDPEPDNAPKSAPVIIIQNAVCKRYGIQRADMVSARRDLGIVRPRQIAMYLAKKLTLRSLPDIGRRFGGRDHTTVMHAIRKVTHLLTIDPELAADIDELTTAIKSS